MPLARLPDMRSFLFLVPALVACAGSSTSARERRSAVPSTSRGMRADAHLDAMREHQARAATLARWPERRRDLVAFEDPGTGLWYRAFDTVAEQERLATAHRTEAAQLQAEFDEACAGVASEEIAVSPLRRYGLGGTPTERGVVVVLSPDAGPGPRLLAAMRCHRASMMLRAVDTEDCSLDLRGIKLETYGNDAGISVEITVDDTRLAPELQRRTARDLEMAAQPN